MPEAAGQSVAGRLRRVGAVVYGENWLQCAIVLAAILVIATHVVQQTFIP